MKLSATAITLFASTTISFAGDFTPIPKGKIVQSQACFNNCQIAFDQCVRLRSGSTNVFRNCESEQSFCTMACQLRLSG
jgi:hypothetical protein